MHNEAAAINTRNQSKMGVRELSLVVRLDDHASRLAKGIADAFDEQEKHFGAVSIRCSDGVTLRAHAVVLSSMCKFNSGNTINMDSVSSEVMRKVLRFVYTGEVELDGVRMERLRDAMAAMGVAGFQESIVVGANKVQKAVMPAKPGSGDSGMGV